MKRRMSLFVDRVEPKAKVEHDSNEHVSGLQRHGGVKDDGRVWRLFGVGLNLTAALELLHREIAKSFRL